MLQRLYINTVTVVTKSHVLGLSENHRRPQE